MTWNCLKKKVTVPGNLEEETITYRRKKAKGKRQAIFQQFKPEVIHHELMGEACTCPDCHERLKEIGSCVQRQELIYVPAQLKRVDHIQHAYKCVACSKKNATDKIIKAPVPKAPLAHSLGSASIIAHTIHQKFTLKVPNYRQEADWQKMGLPISRKEIANWHIKSSQYYFEPLYELLHEKLLTQDLLHADETAYRVLENETPLTYYWTFLSGKQAAQPITLYHHDQRRSGLAVQEFLGEYDGYVHCDMWSAYRQLPKAKLVGCWAHVRRKFFEATPKQADKQSLGRKGLAYCDQMFSLEASWAELPSAERLCKRKERLAPLMTTFFDWCRNQSVLPGSKLGRAITYALKYEETFKTVLTDGSLVLSNNLAERAIKGYKHYKREIFTLAHELGHCLLGIEEVESVDMMDISAQTSYSDVERWCNDFAYQFIMGQEAETLANIACVDSRNDYCIDLFKAISARTHISRLALYTRMYIDRKISYSSYSNVKSELAEEYRRREEQEKLKNSEKRGGRTPKPIISPLFLKTMQYAYFNGVVNETTFCSRLNVKPANFERELWR